MKRFSAWRKMALALRSGALCVPCENALRDLFAPRVFFVGARRDA